MERVFNIKHVGDSGISVEFSNEIAESVNQQVAQLKQQLGKADIEGIEEMIPTYRALLIQYDAMRCSYDELVTHVDKHMEAMGEVLSTSSKVYIIPVCYGTSYGPDLTNVASSNDLTEKEVVAIHSSVDYRIYMLGFTPGFPYLGGMDNRIATPRLQQPRTKITAGSVGIAGKQTGIYPIDSPGGWQIIGRTPVKLFDQVRENSILLEAGAYIRFNPVDDKTYKEIEKQVLAGTYVCETAVKESEGV